MTYEPPVTDYDYIVENCTCAFCGCNCDDLDYLVKNNHVVAVIRSQWYDLYAVSRKQVTFPED
jgi:hypothetical protein